MNPTKKTLTHPKYRADIDGLRAIAVLLVVTYHAFPSSVKCGFIGVDMFFVISGFLISTILFENLQNQSFSFFEFYSRRIMRIFPALLLVLTSCFLFGWYLLLADEYKNLGKHIAAGAGFISNFVFWNENGYFDNAMETKPLLHLWSLGIEEQFYIIWPLMLWIAWKKKINWLSITLVVALISFTLNLRGIKQDSVATFYSPQTRFWELLLGSILAYISLGQNNVFSTLMKKFKSNLTVLYQHPHLVYGSRLPNILSLTGFSLLAIALFITRKKHFPGSAALLPTIGTICIIAAGSTAWLNRTALTNRILVWFGLISFPLYLWHWPLLSFARIIASETPTRTIRLAAVLVAILLAWLTYRLIEMPIRFGKFRKVKACILFVLMIVMGNAGYYIYTKNGFASRFPAIIREITSFQYDFKSSYRYHSCFLEADQDAKQFADCGVTRDKHKKTILIWGDSHAAHLYPGFKEIFGANYNIIQRTASLCAPILGFSLPDRKFCKEINNSIFELIKNEKPDKIILAAAWELYDWQEVIKLTKTIERLKMVGATNIHIIGPVPFWNDGLPKQLYNHFKKHRQQTLPSRMKEGLNKNFRQIEPKIKLIAKNARTHYISPASILCNTNEGCLTKLGDSIDSLVAWDSAHLTEKGSVYLVSKFEQKIAAPA